MPGPSPGDLPDAGTEPVSPALQADSLPSQPLGKRLLVVVAIDVFLLITTCPRPQPPWLSAPGALGPGMGVAAD